MGFILGQAKQKQTARTNKKFVLGSSKRETSKKKVALLEKRMQPREKPTAGEVLWNEKLTPKFDTASMNLLAQNAVKPKATNPLIGAFEKQQTKKYGITPTDIRDDSLKKLSESELKSLITQFASGAYEGSNTARGVSALQKLSGQKEPLIAKLARDTQPHQTGWRTAGKVYSGVLENAAMYGTVGKAAEGWKALEGIKSPFLQNLAGQQLADTIIQTPSVIMQGVADKKSIGGIAKDVGLQQAQDLGANLLFGTVGEIFKKLKAKKSLTQVEIETVNATPELRALPEAKQYLMLPEGKVTTPNVIEALPPKPTVDEMGILKNKPLNTPTNKDYPNLEMLDATDLKA